MSDGGLFDITNKGISNYVNQDLKKKLEMSLQAAKIEREKNKDFDKNADLDAIIKKDIPDAIIEGNKVTIGGIIFYLNRNTLNLVSEEIIGEVIEKPKIEIESEEKRENGWYKSLTLKLKDMEKIDTYGIRYTIYVGESKVRDVTIIGSEGTVRVKEEGENISISAYTVKKDGRESEAATLNIKKDSGDPTKAELTVVEQTAKTIEVTAVGEDEAAGIGSYEFQYKAKSEENYKIADTIETTNNSCNYTYTGLDTYTAYDLKVIVRDKAGNSRESNVINQNAYKLLIASEDFEYVTDGLMLHYDAIANTRLGHNSSTTIWEDLSGNDRNGILIGGTWGDNYLSLNGTGNGVSIGNQLQDLFKGDNTIEMILNFDSDESRAILIGNYSVSNNINYERSGDKTRIYFNSGSPDSSSSSADLTRGTKYSMTYVFNKGSSIITGYKNSSSTFTLSDSRFKSYNYNWMTVYIGRDSRTGSTCLKGKVLAVRIYNRVLSSEEISKNYEIDQTRFGI